MIQRSLSSSFRSSNDLTFADLLANNSFKKHKTELLRNKSLCFSFNFAMKLVENRETNLLCEDEMRHPLRRYEDRYRMMLKSNSHRSSSYLILTLCCSSFLKKDCRFESWSVSLRLQETEYQFRFSATMEENKSLSWNLIWKKKKTNAYQEKYGYSRDLGRRLRYCGILRGNLSTRIN